MSKDFTDSKAPKKKGLKNITHGQLNSPENGVNFLTSNVVNHLHGQSDIASHTSVREACDTNDSISVSSKNVYTCPRHVNGVQLSVACKDVLRIHRCSSDGKLTEFGDGSNEAIISRSMSSSDFCMNGSHGSDSTPQASGIARTDNKCNGVSGVENNQGGSKTRHGKTNPNGAVMAPGVGDSATAKSNDIVRPKTWSRKLAEKSKRKRDSSGKDTAKNNTHSANEPEIEDKSALDGRTCKVFEHDRNLIQQQRSNLVNGNIGAQCSVIEIVPQNESQLGQYVDDSASVASGELETRTGILVCESIDTCTDSKTDNLNHTSDADMPALVVAPLAQPEDVSDDEIGACYSSSTGNNSVRSTGDSKSTSDQLEYDFSESNIELISSESHLKSDAVKDDKSDQVINGAQAGPSRTFAVYPESIFSRAPDEDDLSLSFGYSSPLSNTVSGASPSGDTVTLLERHDDARNVNAQNLQQVSSSSMDSLEEIGDYIETDLPPNRLAFFSRGSSSSTTTEEDEGCGDEVLLNNDEESDNETIDPLNSYHNPGLPNLPDVQYNNQPLSFSMNLGSERCQNPPFRNENWGQNFLGNSMVSSRLVKSAPSCDSEFSGSYDTLLGRNRVESQRHENGNLPSINDMCSNSHENSEDVAQGNSGAFKLPNTNCRNPNESAMLGLESNENHERLSRKDENVRHSSSGSEAAGMMYIISDDSENVSPEFESGMEYVFPSIGMSASFSGGTFSRHQQNIVFGDPSINPRNHSASLDFDREEEILHCPFFVRRARSLDQEIDTRCRPQNRLSDVDTPNIPVASSNLQHDVSNQNQKVFEKSAFEVMGPLPTWDSSDEDENNRVPESEGAEEEPLDQIFESMENQLTHRQGEAMNHLSSDFAASNISVPEDEPIYEEIDDLLVLMDEICSEGEPDNLQPVCNAISKLRRKRRHRSPVSDVEKVMIWNEYEAYVVQVKQIGTSACGPTAVLNVLKAFDFQVEKEEVCQTITSNMRMEAAPIPYYLFSRSTAGTTAQALVEGVAGVTRGAIKGRFFHFYPQRDVELMKWLGHWMKKGAVPVATLNLQRGVKPGWTIPDAWHHQMVYGVSSKGVYLTNPLEIVPENVIMDQLTSDSVLLVRRHDVVSRFRDWCPLNEILKQRDLRWRTMNVIGQVVHMLRETMVPQEQTQGVRAQLMSHISIPAVYKAGIILFMRANTETYEELLKAPELPLKQTDNTHPS